MVPEKTIAVEYKGLMEGCRQSNGECVIFKIAGKKAYVVCQKVMQPGGNYSLVSRVGFTNGCQCSTNTEAEMVS